MLNGSAPTRRTALFLGTIVLFSLSVAAQQEDWHIKKTDLFVKCAFAHGYMHGYEEGFHTGDLDLQMGRPFRDVKANERFKKPNGYKSQFGSRSVFDAGFRKGLLVGYTDAFAGRNFRAVQLFRETAAIPTVRPGEDRDFDNAFMQGYETGQKKGLEDGRSSAAENSAPQQCQEQVVAKGGSGEPKANYCEAFRGGYQLGYSDGFTNQRDARVLAQK